MTNLRNDKKEIPVYLEFDEDRQVAAAEVEIHDDKIYAIFEIQDEIVETMLKEGAKLTPCTGMVMIAVQEKFDPEKDTAHLVMIGLCKSGNVDGRIPPL